MKFVLFLAGLLAIIPAFCNAEDVQSSPGQLTLQQQYNSLKTEQEVIDGFRMVKLYVMDQFWKTVQDSLQAQRASIRASAVLTASQAKDIEALKASLTGVEKSKADLTERVDNLVVMGRPYSKTGFITGVSFVILGLVILSVLLFTLGRASVITTRELRKLNESMYQEFEAYKHQTVEKQIKLSRELQDYRNRLAEIKSI